MIGLWMAGIRPRCDSHGFGVERQLRTVPKADCFCPECVPSSEVLARGLLLRRREPAGARPLGVGWTRRKEYPDAGHGFLTNHDRADQRGSSMGKITGASYHEPSAQDARRRIVSFFNRHLKS